MCVCVCVCVFVCIITKNDKFNVIQTCKYI